MSQLKWPAAICSRAKQVSRGWGKQTLPSQQYWSECNELFKAIDKCSIPLHQYVYIIHGLASPLSSLWAGAPGDVDHRWWGAAQEEKTSCCLVSWRLLTAVWKHVGNAEVLFYPSSNIGGVITIVLKLFIYQKMQNQKCSYWKIMN